MNTHAFTIRGIDPLDLAIMVLKSLVLITAIVTLGAAWLTWVIVYYSCVWIGIYTHRMLQWGTGIFLPFFDGITVMCLSFSIPLLLVLWFAVEQWGTPRAYIIMGVALMLWPMQCAFWLGERSEKLRSQNDHPADSLNRGE